MSERKYGFERRGADSGGFLGYAKYSSNPYYQPSNIPALRSALAQAQQNWTASRIQNYRYTLNYGYSMEVSGDQTVTVRGGKVPGSQAGQTMEQLFAELESRIDRAAAPNSCVTVEAEYSAADGHILSSSWADSTQGLMDAFGGYRLTHFRVEK